MSMVLQNHQKLIEITSDMIYIVALGVGLKCPRKIHLNTQCPPGSGITVYYARNVNSMGGGLLT